MNTHIPAPQSIDELDLLATTPSPGVIETLRRTEGDLLVAGAGGKMGFHVAKMLRRALNELNSDRVVVAVSRFGNPQTREIFESEGIHTISADLTEERGLMSLPDAESVFFLAGKKFGTSGQSEELHLYNEIMPRLVAKRFRDSRIVALSTGCVYPFVTQASGGCTEEVPADPVGDYAISCLGRERAFLEESERYGTPLALIRLNYSVDLRYGVLVDLALRIQSGEPVDVGMGYFNCIWQGDAVSHIVQALGLASPAPDACILNVTGERTLSVRETAEALAERMGRSVTFSGHEAETAWLNSAVKAHQAFGVPVVSEDQLIDWVADWVGHGRDLLGLPTHFEVRDGKY